MASATISANVVAPAKQYSQSDRSAKRVINPAMWRHLYGSTQSMKKNQACIEAHVKLVHYGEHEWVLMKDIRRIPLINGVKWSSNGQSQLCNPPRGSWVSRRHATSPPRRYCWTHVSTRNRAQLSNICSNKSPRYWSGIVNEPALRNTRVWKSLQVRGAFLASEKVAVTSQVGSLWVTRKRH